MNRNGNIFRQAAELLKAKDNGAELTEDKLGHEFLAGKKLWAVCGRGVEYEAELILLKKEG